MTVRSHAADPTSGPGPHNDVPVSHDLVCRRHGLRLGPGVGGRRGQAELSRNFSDTGPGRGGTRRVILLAGLCRIKSVHASKALLAVGPPHQVDTNGHSDRPTGGRWDLGT